MTYAININEQKLYKNDFYCGRCYLRLYIFGVGEC